MDIDEPGWPLIDDFFWALGEGRKPATLRRYARVRFRLYDFLDTDDMTAWLAPDEATLLAAEREFGAEGALRDAVGLNGLLRCLPGFVAVDRLPTTVAEARMQISVTTRFVAHVRDRRLVPKCQWESLLVARRAVVRAKSDLELMLNPRSAALQAVFDAIDAAHAERRHPPTVL